jgi:type I restriction enzyme S subunit
MMSGKMYRFRLPERYVSARYVQYYLQSGEAKVSIDRMKTGGSDSGLNLTHDRFRRLRVPLAPRREQERIVAAIEEQFSRLDAGLAALAHVRQNLKQMRAAVMDAAATGGLSTSGGSASDAEHFLIEVLQARTERSSSKSRRASTPVLPAPSSGSFPGHWTEASLDMLAESSDAITDGPFGSNLKSSHYTNDGPRVIRLQNIGDGGFVDVSAHISPDHFNELEKHSVKPGDLVCALLGETLPRAVVIPDNLGPAIVKADCARVRVSPLVNRRFVWAVLNSPRLRQEISARVHGVGRPRLNLSELREIAIPLPTRGEQDTIVETMDHVLEASRRLEATLVEHGLKATALRSSILSNAFSGRLVQQDPRDEPASGLLERIAAERASSNGHRANRSRKTRSARIRVPA